MGPKINSDIRSAMKEAIRDLINDEEFLDKLLSRISEKLDLIQTDVRKNTDKIKQLEIRVENMQQNEKVNNICVYNLPEEDHENVENKFLQICKENLGLDMTSRDIARCYRAGKKSERIRPIIVKFNSYHSKKEVMRNMQKLTGTGIGISEDLTKNRLVIYHAAGVKMNRKNVFTRYGNVFIRIGEKVQKIVDLASLERISLEIENQI